MAGDWIKIEHALPHKPEIMAMADRLGISEMEVVGHLICFWAWVDQNFSDICPVARGTFSGLDRRAGRDGFAAALVEVGWLVIEDGNITIPNYDDHLSQSAKARALEAKRKRKERRKSRTEPDKCPDTNRTDRGQNAGPEESREIDREIERDLEVLPEKNNLIQSIYLSLLTGTKYLPMEIWTADSEKMIFRRANCWVNAEFGKRARETTESEAESFVGAILAARNAKADNPSIYVGKCLEHGVAEGWRAKARALIKRPEEPLI